MKFDHLSIIYIQISLCSFYKIVTFYHAMIIIRVIFISLVMLQDMLKVLILKFFNSLFFFSDLRREEKNELPGFFCSFLEKFDVII